MNIHKMPTNGDLQFPHVSKYKRAFIVLITAPVAMMLLATGVLYMLRNPFPKTVVGWVVMLVADSVGMAGVYLMLQFSIWAIVYTPRSEMQLIACLTRFAKWGIALVVTVVVLLIGWKVRG